MTTMLYTRPDCAYCDAARRSLEATGEPYEEIDVTSSAAATERLLELTGGEMVTPVLVETDGEVRVGYGGV